MLWFILAQETASSKTAEGWFGLAETIAGLSATTLLAGMVLGLIYIIWWRLLPDIKIKDTIIAEFEQNKALALAAKDIAHTAAIKEPEATFKVKLAQAEKELAEKRVRMSGAMVTQKAEHAAEIQRIRDGYQQALVDLRSDLQADIDDQKAVAVAIRDEYIKRLDARDREYVGEIKGLTAALTATTNQGVRMEAVMLAATALITKIEARLNAG